MRVERTEGLLAKGVWYGAGAGAASGVVGLGALLRFEAWRARRTVGEPTKAPPYLGGTYCTGLGRPVVLFVAGDSLAAGLGVRREETLVAHIARQLSERSHRPVHVISTAKVGARSADLAGQLGTGLHLYPRPDVSLLIIGANDVTHFHGLADAPRQLAAAVDRLRSVGSEVVVGTCPDIGTVEPIWQPLRGLAGKVSHEYAGRQENAAVEAGRTWWPWVASSASSSPSTLRRCSDGTGSTRPRAGTRREPRRCCPPCSPPQRRRVSYVRRGQRMAVVR